MPCRDAVSAYFMRMRADRDWHRCLLNRYALSVTGIIAFFLPFADLCGEICSPASYVRWSASLTAPARLSCRAPWKPLCEQESKTEAFT